MFTYGDDIFLHQRESCQEYKFIFNIDMITSMCTKAYFYTVPICWLRDFHNNTSNRM